MIPLKNAETTYTFMAIITEKDNRLNFKKSDTVIKQVRRTGVPDSNYVSWCLVKSSLRNMIRSRTK